MVYNTRNQIIHANIFNFNKALCNTNIDQQNKNKQEKTEFQARAHSP